MTYQPIPKHADKAMTHRQFEAFMAKRLLPCPCCGKRPRVVQWRDTLNPNATWIECKSKHCGLMTPTTYNKSPLQAALQAEKIWNRRTKA